MRAGMLSVGTLFGTVWPLLFSLSSEVTSGSEKIANTATVRDSSEDGSTSNNISSTHKQSQIIKPLVDDKSVSLNTFCLDRDGNILACVGDSVGHLQMISPDGKLIRSTRLPFVPTAVNQAPDGQIFVAGHGNVAVISSAGHVITTATSPHVGDKEAIKARVLEDTRKQRERSQKLMQDQITRIDERIAAITEKAESERTETETKRLVTFQQQKMLYETQLKNLARTAGAEPNVDQMIARKLGITALAVTSRDVFLCCTAIEGTGYEVWRTNHELSEPVRVVSELRGCCGQCDIQATDEHLILAENTRFQVALLDRDGRRASSFGKGDRKAIDGFGSCCNPMNVRCCSNGDILTAESSIGTIKRFNKDGVLVGIVGKAKIGGGCKHVAVAIDEKRNRYYMMNVDKDHICVLVPLAEAPEITSEEEQADVARNGLAKKLIGEWSLDGSRPANAATVQTVLPTRIAGDPYSSIYLNFGEDGSLQTIGGMAGVEGWEPIRQDGNVLYASQVRGGIQYYEYKVEFVSDDEATISLVYSDRVLGSNRYKRIAAIARE